MKTILIVALFVAGAFAAVDEEVAKWMTDKAMDHCFGEKLLNQLKLYSEV